MRHTSAQEIEECYFCFFAEISMRKLNGLVFLKTKKKKKKRQTIGKDALFFVLFSVQLHHQGLYSQRVVLKNKNNINNNNNNNNKRKKKRRSHHNIYNQYDKSGKRGKRCSLTSSSANCSNTHTHKLVDLPERALIVFFFLQNAHTHTQIELLFIFFVSFKRTYKQRTHTHVSFNLAYLQEFHVD